jgi:hypothetical protein
MIIDNGRRRRLVVSGVFDGMCGESEGLLSFIPNLAGKKPEAARGGLLDGEPIALTIVRTPDRKNPFVTAEYRLLS